MCIIEHLGNADAVPQPPERCLSRKAGIVRCCPKLFYARKCRLGRCAAGAGGQLVVAGAAQRRGNKVQQILVVIHNQNFSIINGLHGCAPPLCF